MHTHYLELMINAIAKYNMFSTINLWSANHHVSIKESGRPNRQAMHCVSSRIEQPPFQAGSALCQFVYTPFRVMNGVACFQRTMTKIMSSENLQGTFCLLG